MVCSNGDGHGDNENYDAADDDAANDDDDDDDDVDTDGSRGGGGGGDDDEDVENDELDFYRTAGPVEWAYNASQGEEGYQNTFWDERRKVYIQEQKGIDPNLELRGMRQHMLDVRRMRSMCAVGRVVYFRAIVVVGNGNGVYGFGVGFGNTPKESRSDAMLKALQNPAKFSPAISFEGF
eukprot:s1446_g2.t1